MKLRKTIVLRISPLPTRNPRLDLEFSRLDVDGQPDIVGRAGMEKVDACTSNAAGSARANNAVFRSDRLSRWWMLPPTQILIQTSACSCPDASLSRLTIIVAVELSAPRANIPAIPSFVHRLRRGDRSWRLRSSF